MRQVHLELFFQRIAKLPKIDKEFSRCFCFLGQGRDRHQTFDRQPVQRKQLLHLSSDRFRFKTKLAPLACQIDLEENARMRSFFFRDPIYLPRKIDIVDAVEELEERERVPDLVLLEMTDEVPAQVYRQFRNLDARFLHPAFAKQRLASVISGAHLFGVVRFRDRHELDLIQGTSAFLGRFRDLRLNALQIFGNRHELIVVVEALVPSACLMDSMLATVSTATILALTISLANPSVLGHNNLIMKSLLLSFTLMFAFVCSDLSAQTKIDLQPSDTIVSILQKNVGQAAELRMQSGEKIGGKVEKVGDKLVQLSQLTGMEYFDAAVDISHISAVIVRVKSK
jgi:hypothetical protein